MYAIRHKKKNKFVYAVRKDLDASNPDRIKLSYDKALTFLTEADALFFMVSNNVHKSNYEPVKIAISTMEGNLRF